MHAIPWPGEPTDDAEAARVAAQIGRDPRGEVAVAVRCEYGLPAVVRTRPRLDDGSPFPTLYYLTCPMAVRALGALEASGLMANLNDRLAADEDLAQAYRDADERYRTQRDSLEDLGEDMQTAGGMPGRVKCLHALAAHHLADANPVGAIAWDAVDPLGCPEPCVEASDEGAVARVQGHPGFKGKKRRR